MRDAIKSVLITVLCFAVFLAIYVIGEISGWFKKADNLAAYHGIELNYSADSPALSSEANFVEENESVVFGYEYTRGNMVFITKNRKENGDGGYESDYDACFQVTTYTDGDYARLKDELLEHYSEELSVAFSYNGYDFYERRMADDSYRFRYYAFRDSENKLLLLTHDNKTEHEIFDSFGEDEIGRLKYYFKGYFNFDK